MGSVEKTEQLAVVLREVRYFFTELSALLKRSSAQIFQQSWRLSTTSSAASRRFKEL
jgi:hypothetical protein